MKIIPAILTDNKEDFQNKISQAEGVCDFAQIDIMDGVFVPSKSVGQDALVEIKSKIGLEFHLMVENPLDYLKAATTSGVKRIIFHYEAKKIAHSQIIKEIRALGMQVGLAINPPTTLSQINHLLNDIDLLLFMAVNPGYYGSAFIPEVLDKVRKVSSSKHDFIIALDGGVKLDNILEIKNSGVELVCVGSAIFKGKPLVNYRNLMNKISGVDK